MGNLDSGQRQVVVDLTKLKSLSNGLGQFSLHLGRALARTPAPHLAPVFLTPPKTAHLLHGTGVRQIRARCWMKEGLLRLARPWAHHLLPTTPRIALWHATTQCTKYLPLDERVPVILTIHDLNFLREKSPKVAQRYLRRLQILADRAVAIATDSQFVAGEVGNHLELRGKPLRVIYLGRAAADHSDAERPSFVPERPFLFTISDITPKKNFHVLLDLIRRLPQYALVIAGNDRTPYARQIRRIAAQTGVADRVILPGIVSDAARCWLYRNCAAFLFPSTTEGFGLPVIEAMQFGKPVFVSNATSLPEIAGPLAFYWRCFVPEHMQQVFCDGMARYLRDASYPVRLAAHARQFSWDKVAAEYVAFYGDILEHTCAAAPRLAAA